MISFHRGLVLGILVAVVLAASAASQSQPKFHRLHGGLTHGVFFLDSQRGWTAEDGGVIRYTTNSGVNWTEVTFPQDEDNEAIRVPLQGIFVQTVPDQPSEVRAWAVGDNGVVLTTLPGQNGTQWRDANPASRVADARDAPLPCGQNLSKLYNIYMLSDGLTGWVVGLDGALRKTVNGGLTWFNPFTPATDPFPCDEDPRDAYDIHFFADSTPGAPYTKGIFASEYDKVFTTTDAGATWSEVDLVLSVPGICPSITGQVEFWAIDFDNPLLSMSPGWLVGGIGNNRGYIFRTTGGGVFGSWEQTKCVDFLSPNEQVGICGLSTMYSVVALNSSDPTAVSGGYDAGVFDYRAGTADFNPCATPCVEGNPGNPCGAGAPTWVQLNVDLFPVEPCDSQPPIFGAAKISSTEACLVGSFGRILH